MIYRDLFGGIYRNKSKLLYDSYIIFYSLEILIMPHGSSSTGSLKSCYCIGLKKTQIVLMKKVCSRNYANFSYIIVDLALK